MQHKFSENLREVEEELLTKVLEAVPAERRLRGLPPEDLVAGLSEGAELLTKVLEAVPAERRLRGLPPEERLRGLPPEERLRGLSLEDRLAGLSEEDAARLRELLERKQGR